MKAITAQTLSLPKVYRHFAVITVAVTLLVAVFADGENREALAQSAAAQSGSTHAIRIEKPKKKERDGQAEGSFGTTGGQFGAPMVSPGGSRDDNLRTTGPQQVAASYNPSGLSDEEWAKLSPAKREELVRKLREQRYGASPEARSREVANMVAASAGRSGSNSSDDD
jgi:hypothetical protein